MNRPIIIWFRRDLRLSDHEALSWAAQSGRPIIPVFINDDIVQSLGAAPKWRLGLAVKKFGETLGKLGSKLILRKGDPVKILADLAGETDADTVIWSRGYDAMSVERDKKVKASLIESGLEARSFAGHLLYEPWHPKTKAGGYFKVYTPFWRNVSAEYKITEPLRKVVDFRPYQNAIQTEALADWVLGKEMDRGANVVSNFVRVGEEAALDRLAHFIDEKVDGYREGRDFPEANAVSGLSENLTYGEISPRQMYYAGLMARDAGKMGAEHFLKEITWREFAYHLLWHFPELDQKEWRAEWAAFSWRQTGDLPWKQGRTGVAFVDAAMRELYVTGIMHNRLRMIVGSYLTKNMLIDWRVGMRWFAECLIDWDPAANAMGWQWIAGCGPDAAPYFRIFNPMTQADKFDASAHYRNRFLDVKKSLEARLFYDACPRSWRLNVKDDVTEPKINLSQSRKDALLAYEKFKESKS